MRETRFINGCGGRGAPPPTIPPAYAPADDKHGSLPPTAGRSYNTPPIYNIHREQTQSEHTAVFAQTGFVYIISTRKQTPQR